MRIGFIVNDLHSMNLEKDTSIYLMKEAFMRGNEIYAFDATDVTHKNSNLYANCTKIQFPNPGELSFDKSEAENINIKEFKYVINRLNPPFNKEYLYLTQLLEISGVDCINPAKALRENNEKLIILNFPNLIPFSKVTNSLEELYSDKINKLLDMDSKKAMDDAYNEIAKEASESYKEDEKLYPEVKGFQGFGMTEGANIQYYPPGGGYFVEHCERTSKMEAKRCLVWMTYLNDVPNAGTNFKYQKLTTPAKKGLTLIWPTG